MKCVNAAAAAAATALLLSTVVKYARKRVNNDDQCAFMGRGLYGNVTPSRKITSLPRVCVVFIARKPTTSERTANHKTYLQFKAKIFIWNSMITAMDQI